MAKPSIAPETFAAGEKLAESFVKGNPCRRRNGYAKAIGILEDSFAGRASHL